MIRLRSFARALWRYQGFRNEAELADEVLKVVSRLGQGLLDSGSLNDEQTRGVRDTLRDTPIAFAALTCAPFPEEQRANLVFMCAKMIDDILNLGATAVAAGSETVVSSVIKETIDRQAALARSARSNKPANIALAEAIDHFRGEESHKHPYKEADRILELVNKKLGLEGHDPVNVDKIYRRLRPKPPASALLNNAD